MNWLPLAITLLLVMGPFGNVPVLLGLEERALAIAGGVVLLTVIAVQMILNGLEMFVEALDT